VRTDQPVRRGIDDVPSDPDRGTLRRMPRRARGTRSDRRVVVRRRGLATFCAGLSASLISPVAEGAAVQAAQRGHQVLLRAAPAAGVAAGHDVGLGVAHRLDYLVGRTAPLMMALPRSQAGKLDGGVVTGHLAWGAACGSARHGRR
jgi:hypothetical protein